MGGWYTERMRMSVQKYVYALVGVVHSLAKVSSLSRTESVTWCVAMCIFQ